MLCKINLSEFKNKVYLRIKFQYCFKIRVVQNKICHFGLYTDVLELGERIFWRLVSPGYSCEIAYVQVLVAPWNARFH